jgi:hypothetical protein
MNTPKTSTAFTATLTDADLDGIVNVLIRHADDTGPHFIDRKAAFMEAVEVIQYWRKRLTANRGTFCLIPSTHFLN